MRKTNKFFFLMSFVIISQAADAFSQSIHNKAIKQFRDLIQSDNNWNKEIGFESLLENSYLIDTIWTARSSEQSYGNYFTYDNKLNMTGQYSEGTYKHSWAPTRKMILYNENKDVIEYIEEKQEGQAWLYIKREEYDYDEGNRIVREWKENWNNEEVEITVFNYTYEENIITIEKGFFELDVFDLYETSTLTIDSLGNIISAYKERIDYKSDYLFHYTTDNKISAINSIGYNYVNNDNWVKSDSTSDVYEYDSSQNLISRDYGIFSFIEDSWKSSLTIRNQYYYNLDNKIEKGRYYKIIDPSSLFLQEYSNTYTYNYGSSGKLISKIDSSYNGNYNYRTENPPVRTSFKYDSKDRLQNIFIEENYNSEWNPKFSSIQIFNHNIFGDTLTLWGENFRISYDDVTSVEVENKNLPINFTLHQNYPNPFNPSTTIEYSIPGNVKRETANGFIPSGVEGELVQLKVYDILGKEVTTLVNQKQKPGYYKVNFFASPLPSGVYFYRLVSGSFSETKKFTLMK